MFRVGGGCLHMMGTCCRCLQSGHPKARWRGFFKATDFSRRSPQAMFILILFQINQWKTHPESLGFTGGAE